MVINADHPAIQGDQRNFWREEIDNSKILLYEINRAIDYLTKNRYARYVIDTGQDQMTVQHQDLPALYDKRSALIKQIEELQNMLGIGPDQGPPAFVARPL
jgi:hypothetical protein